MSSDNYGGRLTTTTVAYNFRRALIFVFTCQLNARACRLRWLSAVAEGKQVLVLGIIEIDGNSWPAHEYNRPLL